MNQNNINRKCRMFWGVIGYHCGDLIFVGYRIIWILSFLLLVACDSHDVRALKQLANSGDHQAQKELGFMYSYAYGVDGNINEGLKWFKLAASDGDPVAEYLVASIYFERKDYKNSFNWFSKCAIHGDAVCQGMFGTMYLYGQSVTANKSEAIKWLRKSAEQNNGTSQCFLGDIYYSDKAYKQAIPYLEQAALKKCSSAAKTLSEIYKQGLSVAVDAEKSKYWYGKYVELESEDK